ncbi:hypothetical protein BDQ17DRAFT_1434934 [Cyathus striatus]|nr:hypothetical protein BDQ17DRAFT_1434934 [Cyathus striatus]
MSHLFFPPLTNHIEFSPEQTPSPDPAYQITNRNSFNRFENSAADSDHTYLQEFEPCEDANHDNHGTQHNISSDAVIKLGSKDRAKLCRPPGTLGWLNGGGWSLKKTLGWRDDFYKEIQDNIHLIAQKHLDKKNAFVKQDRSNVTLFHQEVQSIYPILSEYPSSWPIDAFAEMYLKNTSAEHQKHLKARNRGKR